MPRKPRFFLPDMPAHVVQRGNNRQAIFFADKDYRVYLGWVHEAAQRWGCVIHAYVLMTNHVHLLMTPQDSEAISRVMQYVGRRYVPYVNQTYGRHGTLWEGRFKASLIQSEAYLLTCHRYIELNPVRAGIVTDPGDYPWSSYRSNALGERNPVLSAHAEYLALGDSAEARQAAYRQMFGETLDDPMLKQLRASLQTGTPFGDHRFRERIEQTLGRKIGFASRGRPRKPAEEGERKGEAGAE